MHHQHGASLNRLAFSATAHCLTGCAIGEVLGMVIGTALSWNNWQTIAIAIVLAFCFGYSFTLVPLLGAGVVHGSPHRLRSRHDLDHGDGDRGQRDHGRHPGAMEAGLDNFRFWGSLAVSLLTAGVAAFPVNRWLIARGRGHALVLEYH